MWGELEHGRCGCHTLIVRSAEPVTNHSLVGSMAMARTQPRWPDTTRISFHGACHSGFGTSRPAWLRRMPSVRPALGATGAVAGVLLTTRLVLPPAPLPLLSVSIPCDGAAAAGAALVTPPLAPAPAEGGGRSLTIRYSACTLAIIFSLNLRSTSARVRWGPLDRGTQAGREGERRTAPQSPVSGHSCSSTWCACA